MNSSTRIAINTAATYARSVLSVSLALFSSRWILQALGATDFGLFNVVGSLIIFLTFFNSVMASSAARHFAFAIGKGDTDEVNRWFNTSLSIHLILPLVLISIGWPIAEFAIRTWLTIPPERIDASITVFRISLIGAFVNMASIPFIAMFNAKQRIAEISMWGILQTFMVFTLAWVLTRVSSDRLLFYATGMVGVQVVIRSINILRALCLFVECRLRLHSGFDLNRLKELLCFAAWTLFGNTSTIFRNQGATILLNIYFGPALNAAFGIARQVSAQTNQLSTAMMTAFIPEITARQGRGEHARVMSLSHFSCKISCLLVMIFAIPLIAEMDYVLYLWLQDPPELTAVFCRLILAAFLVDRLTSGYMMAVSAKGKIAGYQATIGGMLLMGLPLAWFFFKMGYPPASLAVAFLITIVIATIGRVLWFRKLFGEPVKNWIDNVLNPCLLVALTASITSFVPRLVFPASFLRLGISIFFSLLIIAIASWAFALNGIEKTFLKNKFTLLLNYYRYRKKSTIKSNSADAISQRSE